MFHHGTFKHASRTAGDPIVTRLNCLRARLNKRPRGVQYEPGSYELGHVVLPAYPQNQYNPPMIELYKSSHSLFHTILKNMHKYEAMTVVVRVHSTSRIIVVLYGIIYEAESNTNHG